LAAEITVCREDRSTASTTILVGNHLYVANVVDSRAVISKAGKGVFFSITFITVSVIYHVVFIHDS
jgi:protein phosphatase 1L